MQCIIIMIIIIYISEPFIYKNIIQGISTFDQRKSFYKVQGLDQKTQMVLSRVFSSMKFDITY